jgi:hypothetical protein
MMMHGKFEEAPANAEPKKRGQTDISEQQAPSARIEATPKKTQPTPRAGEGHFTRADAIANSG